MQLQGESVLSSRDDSSVHLQFQVQVATMEGMLFSYTTLEP